MNKIVLAVGILALAVSLVNTVLLVQLGGQLKGMGDKIEPIAKEVEKLQKFADRKNALPPDTEPKALPKTPTPPPLPPGPFPK